MKKFLIPSILLLSVLISAYRFPQKSVATESVAPDSDTLMSMLALYGQYVFVRENCVNCHYTESGHVPFSYMPQVSLEGVGGRYTDDWHYNHLLDPQSVSPYSNMPAYPDLFKAKPDTDLLVKLMEEAGKRGMKYPKESEKTAVAEFQAQQKAAMERLQTLKIKDKGSEITALIAFLQQIPPSPLQIKMDSIAKAKEDAEWVALSQTLEKDIMRNVLSKNKDTLMMGQTIYTSYCSICHGAEAEGGIGPNLTDEYWLNGGKVADIMRTIQYGVAEKGMISWKTMLTPIEIAQITAYIVSTNGSNPPNAKEPQGEK